MVGEIAAAGTIFNTLKSLTEIIRNVRETNDPDKLRNSAAEMADMVLTAREQASLLQEERETVKAKAAALEKEVERLHAFNEKIDDYEEAQRGPYGTVVYVRKAAPNKQAQAHSFCKHCFDNKKLSTLQPTPKQIERERVFFCPQCKSEYIW